MPAIELTSLTGTEEVSAIVEGYCTYEGIDSIPYSNDHSVTRKSDRSSSRFDWKICFPGRNHNTAFLQQAKTGAKIYNDSLGQCYARPEETRGGDVKETHYFRQASDSNDCGFCAAFFVIHAINHFEKALAKNKDAEPSLATLPAPATNPFREQTRIITRMQAGFYTGCHYLKILHEIKELHKQPDSADVKDALRRREIFSKGELTLPLSAKKDGPLVHVSVIKGEAILKEFFKQKKQEEKTRLTEDEFMRFALLYIPRSSALNKSATYDEWMLYQNIMLYLLLNHFKNTCEMIQNNKESLSLPNVLARALEVDAECKFYSKQDYQTLARQLLPARSAKTELPARRIEVVVVEQKRLVAEEKIQFKETIDHKTFNDILDKYETSSNWVKNLNAIFKNCVSKDRSAAIRNLRKLADHKDIKFSEVTDALKSDSKQRYQRFFSGPKEKAATSTDEVIEKLRDAFIVKSQK